MNLATQPLLYLIMENIHGRHHFEILVSVELNMYAIGLMATSANLEEKYKLIA